MSGWFLLASAIVQYQRKIKLSKIKKIKKFPQKEVSSHLSVRLCLLLT